MTDLADYHWLIDREASRVLSELAGSREPLHRLVTRLRKSFGSDRARLLVEQLELRPKAFEKFGHFAGQMFFRDIPLQQATDLWTARYKTKRFTSQSRVADYCCGIGGDLLALAERGPAIGWDRDPVLVLFAQANLAAAGVVGSTVRVGEVEQHPPAADALWHLDPDRRPEGKRSTQLAWHSPGPETIESWTTQSPNASLKLAPATEVPWESTAELEWISRDRECRQLVVWFGSLATSPGMRRATALRKSGPKFPSPADQSGGLQGGQDSHVYVAHSFAGTADQHPPIASEVREFVYDTDSAIRAANLTAALAVELNCELLGSGEDYLTSDQAISHPLVSCFRVREVLPLRVATLKKHLRAMGIGQLEIKARGVAARPDELRKQLKLTGSDVATLLLTRLGEREIAVLADRIE